MTQNQDETYFHDLGHEGACTAFYRGGFGNLFWGTRTPMFDGFSRVLMDLICSQWHGIIACIYLHIHILDIMCRFFSIKTIINGFCIKEISL